MTGEQLAAKERRDKFVPCSRSDAHESHRWGARGFKWCYGLTFDEAERRARALVRPATPRAAPARKR